MSALRLAIITATFIGIMGVPVKAESNLVTKPSPHSFETTLDRLETAAKNNGLTVFARLDHAAAAKAVGQTMPPETVLVVGSPQGGTPLFLKYPTLAIDLPLKMLVWQDQSGKVFVSYNDAAFMSAIYARHGLDAAGEAMQKAAKGVEGKLATVADEAVK